MSHTNATAADVKEVLNTTLTVTDLKPFLTAAQGLVSARLEGEGYTDGELTEIERWLAAHLAAVRDPRVSEEGVGSSQFRYEGETGLGLDFTRYGQQVQVLEHRGILAALKEQKAPLRYRFSTQ